MRKIPTIFVRDWNGDRSRVLDEPNPDAAWVFAGEGVATRKYDGARMTHKWTITWRDREYASVIHATCACGLTSTFDEDEMLKRRIDGFDLTQANPGPCPRNPGGAWPLVPQHRQEA